MAEPVVVDTMIASMWLGVRRSQRQMRWAPMLESALWVRAAIRACGPVTDWERRIMKPIAGLLRVAVAGGFPLATEDTIFDDVRSLRRKFSDA